MRRSRNLTSLLSNGHTLRSATGMRTALHWAACFGHKDIIQELLLRGANPNAKTALGFTPLALAKRGGFTQCSYLLEIEGSTETARVSSLDDQR